MRTERLRNRATPYEINPSPSTIHASLPSAEGQYSSEGRKRTRSAYR